MTAERGSTAVELAAGVGLLLIPMALLVLSFAPWLERRVFVRSAAAEAARWVILSDGDEPAVSALLAGMASGSGLEPSEVGVSLCGGPVSPAGSAPRSTCLPLLRGGVVSVEVSTDVPLVRTPFGHVGGLTVSARHVEMVDLYRSLP